MKRAIVLSILFVGALGVAFSVSQFVWGKAHVPVHKAQVCHNGEVLTVGASAVNGHLGHGDCRLPACDFNNVFHTGEDCSSVGPADSQGRCANLSPRDDACGKTAGCPAGPDCF